MRTLYLGLKPPKNLDCIHCPMIKIIPRSVEEPAIKEMFTHLRKSTHLIFTSQQAVGLFFEIASPKDLINKVFIAVGRATAKQIPYKALTPESETAEGIVDLIKGLALKNPYFLWPHSLLSRSILPDYFDQNNLNYYHCALYDTVYNIPDFLPCLNEIDEIIFTSPSTVQGFIKAFGSIPKDKVLTPIGPVTADALHKWRDSRQ